MDFFNKLMQIVADALICQGELKLKKGFVLVMVFCILLLTSLVGGCNENEETKLRVMTSTSYMTYIVQQVGGNYVEAINLVPPNQHPGNFDVKPKDIQKLATARLFLLHGWPGETYADKLVSSADNPNLLVIKITVEGSWMVPSVQLAATDKVADILSEVDPDNASAYQESAEKYKERIQAKETEIKTRLSIAEVSKINVIASFWQADFLRWAGFNVVATFTSSQSLTPQVVKDLVDTGTTGNVTLIINNLQDGPDAGKAIAEELGVKSLNLSNFPGGVSNTETWEKAIDYNVNVLIDAIK
jgi:zinc transport system substrate-binding protein